MAFGTPAFDPLLGLKLSYLYEVFWDQSEANYCNSSKTLASLHPDQCHHHMQTYNNTIALCIHLGRADVPDVSLRLLPSVLLHKLVLVLVEVALPFGEVFVDQSVRAVLVTHVQLGLLGHLGEWARVDPVVLVCLLLLLEEGEGLGRPVGVPLLRAALPTLLYPTPLP